MKQIDFTKFRKGSKPNGRPIDYCPRCGRKGEKTIYTDGETNYTHAAESRGFFLLVTDSCYFIADEQL